MRECLMNPGARSFALGICYRSILFRTFLISGEVLPAGPPWMRAGQGCNWPPRPL